MSNVGDLGRRVVERRHELGLTSEEVAAKAGMDPTYIRILESSPSPQLSQAALSRLAAALETSVDAVAGGGMEAPPGGGRPSGRPILESLSLDECRVLIAPGGVGRVVFSDRRGPVALPVNFRVLDNDIVFRTEEGSTFVAKLPKQKISFEVDHIDEALTEGWSVLISGEGRVLVDPTERQQALSLDIAPWSSGELDTYVVLVPSKVTGRRIRQRSGDG